MPKIITNQKLTLNFFITYAYVYEWDQKKSFYNVIITNAYLYVNIVNGCINVNI